MTITENCIIYDFKNDDYHADPCPTPSASRGFLQTLVSKTPLHAFMEHPRLNPNYVSEDSKDFDLGSAAHDYFLEGGKRVEVIYFDDYRKADAREARDAALRAGKCPIISHKFPLVQNMASAARGQIAAHAEHPDAFQNGGAEPSMFWQEDGTWFRTKPDFIQDNDGWIDDYKTTGITGGPDQWIHGTFFDKGYDLQAYMALRAYKIITGKKAKGFRFWVQETSDPHSMYCVVPSELTHDIAEQKFFHGKMLFEKCLKTGRWPGYKNTAYIADPNFKANKGYEDIKVQKQEIDQHDGDLIKSMIDWQAPLEKRA